MNDEFRARLRIPEDQDHDAAPVNPLPGAVVLLALAIFVIEIVLSAADAGYIGGPAGTGWRIEALTRFGFGSPYVDWMVEHGMLRWDYLVRFVTYAFVAPNFSYTLFALVLLLSLGKFVGEAMSGLAVLAVFFGSTIFGALVYWLVIDSNYGLVGAFPGVYGLVGGFTYVLWAGLGGRNVSQTRAFALIAFLAGIQIVYAVVGWLFGLDPASMYDVPARFAGFVAGFALSFLVAPGGAKALLARLRQR